MSYSILNNSIKIRPTVGATYYLGGPDIKGEEPPQQGNASVGLEINADPSDTVKFELNGQVNFNCYREFRQLQLLNPQFPAISIQNGQVPVLAQFQLPQAMLSLFSQRTSLYLGYQQAVFGKTEFPLAPANAFSGSDFSAASRVPVYRSVPAVRADLLLGNWSLFLVATPSSETRNVMPFQIDRLKSTLPVGSLTFVNQERKWDVDGLLGLRGSWNKWGLLLTASREHDHFFKIGGGEFDPLNDTATLRGVYPARETAAGEISGAGGNLVWWLQGNYSRYEKPQNGAVTSPLGEIVLNSPSYSYQGAAGIRYNFPEQYAYLSAQGFYGSLTGNGELVQTVASASGGIEFLNGDLKLGALFNSYFETRQPKFEGFLSLTYQPVPGLEFTIGGRLAQLRLFSLDQPLSGYAGLQIKY
jgi:hypothetical protein